MTQYLKVFWRNRVMLCLIAGLAVGCDRAPSEAPTTSAPQPVSQEKQPEVEAGVVKKADTTPPKPPAQHEMLETVAEPAVAAAANANARWQARQTKAKQRHDALDRFITQPGLLLTLTPQDSKPSDVAPTTIALSLKSSSAMGYLGHAWYDTSTPARAKARLTLVEKADGLIQEIKIHLDPPVTPSGDRIVAPQGDLTFRIVPVNHGLDLQGSMTLGTATHPTPARAALTHGRSIHRQRVQRYDEGVLRVQKLTHPLIETLKDFAVLKTQVGDTEKTTPRSDRIILVRQQDQGRVQWNGKAEWFDTATQKFHQENFDAATVVVEKNQAVLVVPVTGRLYRLALQDGFAGQWLSPTGQAHPVAMSLALAQDNKTRQAQLQAQQLKLQTIKPDTILRGVVPVATTQGRYQWAPAAVRLQMLSHGQLTAEVTYPLDHARVLMRGHIVTTLTGPAIVLAFDRVPAGQIDMRVATDLLAKQLKGQRWTLQLIDTGPMFRFSGSAFRLASMAFELEQSGATWQAKYHTLLEQWLAGQEITLEMTWPASADKDVDPLVMSIKLDKADGRIHGRMMSGGSALHLQGRYTLQGQLTPPGSLATHGVLASNEPMAWPDPPADSRRRQYFSPRLHNGPDLHPPPRQADALRRVLPDAGPASPDPCPVPAILTVKFRLNARCRTGIKSL